MHGRCPGADVVWRAVSSPEMATSSPLVDATRQALAQSGPLANWPGFVREAQRLARRLRRPWMIALLIAGAGQEPADLCVSGAGAVVRSACDRVGRLSDQLFQRICGRRWARVCASPCSRSRQLSVPVSTGAGAGSRCRQRFRARSGGLGGACANQPRATSARSATEDSPVWPLVTSTVDNCLGSECPHYAECFVVRARSEAQAADLVVVNHHLLFADVALKREGFGEILPGAQAFIIDEAHQWPELAVQFFSESLSSRQLLDLARDAQNEAQSASAALGSIQPAAQTLGVACANCDWPGSPCQAAHRCRWHWRMILASIVWTPSMSRWPNRSARWSRNANVVPDWRPVPARGAVRATIAATAQRCEPRLRCAGLN